MAKTKAEFEGIDASEIAFIPEPLVNCRVLKRGDGKISTGAHDVRGGEVLFEMGETFQVGRSIAEALEGRDYVEISEIVAEPEPVKAPRKAPALAESIDP